MTCPILLALALLVAGKECWAGVNFTFSRPVESIEELLAETEMSDRLKADQIAPQVLRALADKGQHDVRGIVDYLLNYGTWRIKADAREYLERHIYQGAVEQYREKFRGASFNARSEIITEADDESG